MLNFESKKQTEEQEKHDNEKSGVMCPECDEEMTNGDNEHGYCCSECYWIMQDEMANWDEHAFIESQRNGETK